MLDLISKLNLKYPIIQAPMAGVQDSRLALAVSQAGGLGSIPCAMLSLEQLSQTLQSLQAYPELAFNLNFFCHTPPPDQQHEELRWQERLQPYYQELGIQIPISNSGPQRQPFNAQMLECLLTAPPRVVSFHFGLPDQDLLEPLKAAGCLIFSSATTLEEGLWLEAQGVDAVIAQGLEAGGHRGMFLSDDLTLQQGLFTLLPQLVAHLNCPVIAAGGIASPAAVSATLMLGASAAQIGTSYLLCPEAATSEIHRQALTSPAAQHTAFTNLFSGRPARGIMNRLMRELGPISSEVPAFPLASAALQPLRSAAEAQGSGDFSPLWAGQNTQGCRPISAQALTLWLADAHREMI